MKASTITTTTFQLKDASNAVVPATVTYNATTKTATLTPQSALAYGADLHRDRQGRRGRRHRRRRQRARGRASCWSFTIEASPPQLLVVTSTAKPFGSYLGEILRNEGLNAFTTIDVAFLSPALLSGFDVVVLGEAPLNAAQVTTLTGWVNGGGNLIAMRPDKQLAGLLGLTVASGTRSNAYLKVDATVPPGAGIVGSTMQYHGTADNYALNGATAVATLYSNTHDGDDEPGGDAALRRIERRPGGGVHLRPRPLGRLHAPGQPVLGRPGAGRRRRDPPRRHVLLARWLNTGKIAIPQADEQQRLLVNLITLDERRQDAAAALLVPAARREGRRRDERRRPRARPGARRNRQSTSTASRRSARRAATSPSGSACARPRTSTRTAC